MNPDQQIALASVISGGAVAFVGVVVTGIGGWRDRRHSKEMAATDRKQLRLADAYVSLLDYANKVGYWAQNVRPVIDTDPPQPPPATPDFEVYSAVMARVDAYGSAAVQEKLAAWTEAVGAVRRADRLIGLRQDAAQRHQGYVPRTVDEDVRWMDWHTPWGELEEKHRPAEQTARSALKQQVAAELS